MENRPAAPSGPSKNELKKAAKKAERERIALDKAAKARERQEAQAAAEAVVEFLSSTSYLLIMTSVIQDYSVENYGKSPTKATGGFELSSRRGD